MSGKRHDIWSGPIIGYGNASGLSSGGRFPQPGVNGSLLTAAERKKIKQRKSGHKQPHDSNKKHKNKDADLDKAIKSRDKAYAKLKVAEARLDAAKRDKEKRGEAAKRLRYLESCLMRLTLSLSDYQGDPMGFLDLVASFPFDEDYSVEFKDGLVTVKNGLSKHLSLRAYVVEGSIVVGLFGGKKYIIHVAKAVPISSITGIRWNIEDVW